MKYWKKRRVPGMGIIAATATHLTYTRENLGIYNVLPFQNLPLEKEGLERSHLLSWRRISVLIKLLVYCSSDVESTRHVCRKKGG